MLFAALNVLNGAAPRDVKTACRHEEFLSLLREINIACQLKWARAQQNRSKSRATVS